MSKTSPILPGAPLGNIVETDSLGWSDYKGLWLTANERPMKGLQFNASYTLSKSTDTNSLSTAAIVVQDSYNIADSEGPSDFDTRHRFVINAIYDLPFKGNRAKEGWQIAVVTQAQTGSPVNIVTGIPTFTGVNNTLRPDLVGDPAVLGQVTQWFNNSVCDPRIATGAGSCASGTVFALPVSPAGVFHFGNLGRNAVYGPGFGNTDFSVIKNMELRSRRTAAVPRRGVQSVQSGESRIAWPHRECRKHVVRRDHQHAVPDRRLGIGASDSIRDQGAFLEGKHDFSPSQRAPFVLAGSRSGDEFCLTTIRLSRNVAFRPRNRP